MLKRRSLFERCVTLPVGTWSVACKQSFPCVGVHVHNLTTSYFERKGTKLVGNKTAIYRRNLSSVCIFFVKLALLCVFSLFIQPITYARARREHAFDASGTDKPSHNKEGSEKVSTFDKRTNRHKPFGRQRFVSVLWLWRAQLRDLVKLSAVTGERSPPDRNRSIFFFCSNLCRFRSKFAWAFPLSLSSPWTMNFFSQMRTSSENNFNIGFVTIPSCNQTKPFDVAVTPLDQAIKAPVLMRNPAKFCMISLISMPKLTWDSRQQHDISSFAQTTAQSPCDVQGEPKNLGHNTFKRKRDHTVIEIDMDKSKSTCLNWTTANHLLFCIRVYSNWTYRRDEIPAEEAAYKHWKT